MGLKLYDTMTHGPLEVEPLEKGHVRVYTCGPTVYARSHIGNFRTFVFEDVLRRWLERRFPTVTHVMNLTDVEDKIIRNATANGRTLDEETAPWIDGFFEDLDALNIRRAHHYPRATHYIDKMIDIIEALTASGLTYEADGSIYYRVAAFPAYGRLSGVKPADLIAGASGRIDDDEYEKEEARDFALWKSVGPDEIGWETRLGRGRPGWHIECSAMSMSLLGESFDIHCGGVDNIFPHHENEIAQSEGATGKKFANVWCHSAHLRTDGEKMAKSLKNFSTLQDVLQTPGIRPSAVRYLLAARAHYRKPLNYTSDALSSATEEVDRLAGFAQRVRDVQPASSASSELIAQISAARVGFEAAMDDDLNVPAAMGEIFSLLRDVNRELDGGNVDTQAHAALLALIDEVDDVLGILTLVNNEQNVSGGDIDQLLADRATAREQNDWASSDRLRDELALRGVLVEDTASGQRWRKA